MAGRSVSLIVGCVGHGRRALRRGTGGCGARVGRARRRRCVVGMSRRCLRPLRDARLAGGGEPAARAARGVSMWRSVAPGGGFLRTSRSCGA